MRASSLPRRQARYFGSPRNIGYTLAELPIALRAGIVALGRDNKFVERTIYER